MMRRLSNILLLIITIVLGVYLTYQNLKPKPVTVENYVDYWDVTAQQLNQSRWEPTAGPPPMSQPQALENINRVVDFLKQREDENEFQDFRIDHVGLVRLGSETSWWAYQVILHSRGESRSWHRLSFLLLMDGKIAFDQSYYDQGTIAALREFESNEGVEIYWVARD